MTDVPDALVEKAAHALYVAEGGGSSAHWPTEWGELTDGPRHVYLSRARAVLAAVLPDLAEEKRRAIDAALILAAAHDEPAAALRERVAELEYADYVVRCDDPLHQDAADVRRAALEDAAEVALGWNRHKKRGDRQAIADAIRSLAREAAP